MTQNSYIRYMYLRDYDGNPHTCVGIRLVDGGLQYATATYNIEARAELKARMQQIRDLGGIVPAEMRNRLKGMTPFTKKRAREITGARLNMNPITIEMATNGLNYHQITRAVMESIVSRYTGYYVAAEQNIKPYVPTRLENSAYIWICNADEKIRETNKFAATSQS